MPAKEEKERKAGGLNKKVSQTGDDTRNKVVAKHTKTSKRVATRNERVAGMRARANEGAAEPKEARRVSSRDGRAEEHKRNRRKEEGRRAPLLPRSCVLPYAVPIIVGRRKGGKAERNN
jgi:hypothetical protein